VDEQAKAFNADPRQNTFNLKAKCRASLPKTKTTDFETIAQGRGGYIWTLSTKTSAPLQDQDRPEAVLLSSGLGFGLVEVLLTPLPRSDLGQVRDPTASATLHVAMLTGGGAGGNLSAATAAVLPPEDPPRSASDSQSSIGALYYVIAVVLIYGFSIILLIGSQIRKNKHDRGISRY